MARVLLEMIRKRWLRVAVVLGVLFTTVVSPVEVSIALERPIELMAVWTSLLLLGSSVLMACAGVGLRRRAALALSPPAEER